VDFAGAGDSFFVYLLGDVELGVCVPKTPCVLIRFLTGGIFELLDDADLMNVTNILVCSWHQCSRYRVAPTAITVVADVRRHRWLETAIKTPDRGEGIRCRI
jgi:hypothetical protein